MTGARSQRLVRGPDKVGIHLTQLFCPGPGQSWMLRRHLESLRLDPPKKIPRGRSVSCANSAIPVASCRSTPAAMKSSVKKPIRICCRCQHFFW